MNKTLKILAYLLLIFLIYLLLISAGLIALFCEGLFLLFMSIANSDQASYYGDMVDIGPIDYISLSQMQRKQDMISVDPIPDSVMQI
ncbi:hypothetical protein ACSAZL_15770 [Methanosarcina sp. T3]|uniref:hypothetical protein n=1 Tax=Methanosarcina sp. T3 TaxID=3439062 RepID=UPI003F84D15B